MKKYKQIFLLLSLCLSAGAVSAQLHSDQIIQTTLNKMQVINKNLRVVEKTFADIIFVSDSAITDNRMYKHTFSSSNAYHLNAFAVGDDVSDLNIIIVNSPKTGKPKVVATDDMTGNDVSIKFEPAESGTYYVFVSGKLKSGVNNCFFNLIIDRE